MLEATPKLKDMQETYERLEAKMKSFGEEAFKEFFTTVFDKYPHLVAVRWQQYIPYFNDGEPCVFGVHGLEFLDEKLAAELSEEYGDNPTEMRIYDPEWHYAWRDNEWYHVEQLLENLPSEFFQRAFGSHAKVVVTRDAFVVEEYVDHD